MVAPSANSVLVALADPALADPGLPLAQSSFAATALDALLLLAVAALVYLVVRVAQQVREVEAALDEQTRALEAIAARLEKSAAERSDIDLRRTEHVLIDIRDGLKGLEDAVIEAASRPAVVEREIVPAAPPSDEPVDDEQRRADAADGVVERLHNRLNALGYERVQLLGERDLYEMASTGRVEVPVEARRDGVVHKGRCVVEKGRVLDVRMDPPYRLFP